ncbi:hypothetical protein [Streptococcus pluranimalium]|uniref:hypothetical protein n=1 Tax=Streptococcus pluranimalium TaxID=82348 RepID=UPI0039FD9FEA
MTINRQTTLRQILFNSITFLVMLFFNYLGGSGKINNMSQADISDKYFTLITPAGYAFSIWGVIYLLLAISVLYAFTQIRKKAQQELIHKTGRLFIASCAFNALWIVSFSYEWLSVSTVLIFCLLFSLMLLLRKLRGYTGNILAKVVFSLYTSWVLIATFVNISATLVKMNWDGFGVSDSIWTMGILLIAILFTGGYTYKSKNSLFTLGVIWAFIGILSQYLKGVHDVPYTLFITAIILIGIMVLILISIRTFIVNGKQFF